MDPKETEDLANQIQEETFVDSKVILDRILQDFENPELFQTLMRIPNTDYQSLLLELSEKRSASIGSGELCKAMEINPFIQASGVEQKAFAEFDLLAYRLLPHRYMGIELSPLAPFGTNKILAGISQKRVFSVTRNAEVMSDPTTALALHCAKERIKKISQCPKDTNTVSFASSQRVIRQEKVKKKGYSSHFRTFTLAAAGRDVGHEIFEKENVGEQFFFFFSLIKALNEVGGYSINNVEITVANADDRHKELLDILDNSVFNDLRQFFPEVNFHLDPYASSDYYKSLFYRITGFNKDGEGPISIAGGGITNWTEILVGSRKERLLVGSIGTETLCRHFRT